MYINSIQPTNTSFLSGLNPKISQLQNSFDCKNAVSYLSKYNIKSDFLENKPIAVSTTIATIILNKIKESFNFFTFWSPSINVYQKQDLAINQKDLYHFCIPEEKKVLSNMQTFKPAF